MSKFGTFLSVVILPAALLIGGALAVGCGGSQDHPTSGPDAPPQEQQQGSGISSARDCDSKALETLVAQASQQAIHDDYGGATELRASRVSREFSTMDTGTLSDADYHSDWDFKPVFQLQRFKKDGQEQELLVLAGLKTKACEIQPVQTFSLVDVPLSATAADPQGNLPGTTCESAPIFEYALRYMEQDALVVGAFGHAKITILSGRYLVLPHVITAPDDGDHFDVFISFKTQVDPIDSTHDVSGLRNPFNAIVIEYSRSSCQGQGTRLFMDI